MVEQGVYVRGKLFAWKVVWLKLANQTGGYGPVIGVTVRQEENIELCFDGREWEGRYHVAEKKNAMVGPNGADGWQLPPQVPSCVLPAGR